MRVERKERLPHQSRRISTFPLSELPVITPKTNLPEILFSATESIQPTHERDIVVVAQKIVSKAEGRFLDLRGVEVSQRAEKLSKITGRPSDFVQAVINESQEVMEITSGTPDSPGMILVKHRLGHVCTSGGIDKSNTGYASRNIVTLLPTNPDKSARKISQYYHQRAGKEIGVVIVDSMGDAHRLGAIGKAIGVANVPARTHRTELKDLNGKPTSADIAYADSVAAYAMIVMGQTDEGVPAVLISGLEYTIDPQAKISDVLK